MDTRPLNCWMASAFSLPSFFATACKKPPVVSKIMGSKPMSASSHSLSVFLYRRFFCAYAFAVAKDSYAAKRIAPGVSGDTTAKSSAVLGNRLLEVVARQAPLTNSVSAGRLPPTPGHPRLLSKPFFSSSGRSVALIASRCTVFLNTLCCTT